MPVIGRLRHIYFATAFMLFSTTAWCEEAVSVGGALALFNKPAAPKGGVILVPGGDGEMGIAADGTFASLGGNQLVRTRKAYLKHGVATLTVDRGVDVAEAVTYMKKVAGPVVVVATSRGSLRVPGALKAKPDGLVLTSAFLNDLRGQLTLTALPKTLVVHHRQDGCRHTPPSAVATFVAWSAGKATVNWMEGGTDTGDPCQAKGYHGFHGLDEKVVSMIAEFVVSQH